MARIAILATHDFEDVELRSPQTTLLEDGHEVDVVSNGPSEITGKRGWRVGVTNQLAEVQPGDYDALVIPGGYSPDKLRTDADAVAFVKEFAAFDRPLAAICHAGSLLIEADLVQGRRMTSWSSIRTDLVNAGARWEDAAVVVDDHLITSRRPDDLAAFVHTIERCLEQTRPWVGDTFG